MFWVYKGAIIFYGGWATCDCRFCFVFVWSPLCIRKKILVPTLPTRKKIVLLIFDHIARSVGKNISLHYGVCMFWVYKGAIIFYGGGEPPVVAVFVLFLFGPPFVYVKKFWSQLCLQGKNLVPPLALWRKNWSPTLWSSKNSGPPLEHWKKSWSLPLTTPKVLVIPQTDAPLPVKNDSSLMVCTPMFFIFNAPSTSLKARVNLEHYVRCDLT